MKEKIWDLFKITGDIKYYMMFKEMENIEKHGEEESERDSDK